MQPYPAAAKESASSMSSPEGASAVPTAGTHPTSPRLQPTSSPTSKRKPVPTRSQTPSSSSGPTAGTTVSAAREAPRSPAGAKSPTPKAADNQDQKASKVVAVAHPSRPTTPATGSRPATPKLATLTTALRAGHTARAPEHTGPSTGTIVSVAGAPSPMNNFVKHPAALSTTQVRRGGLERSFSPDNTNVHDPSLHQGRATPIELSGRATPADYASAFNTPMMQTPEPGLYSTSARSAASSVNSFHDAPGAVSSRPGSTFYPGSPGSPPAGSEVFSGTSTPPRFAASPPGSPLTPASRQFGTRNSGVSRSISLGHGFQRPRFPSGNGPMLPVQEGLNRARSQGHRRVSQFDEPVNHNLMNLVGFDSAYPSPALNAHTSTKRFSSINGSSVPSSATGSSEKVESPYTSPTVHQPGSQKVSNNGSVHNSYGHDDYGESYPSPVRSSLNSSLPTQHTFGTSQKGTSPKYTPITRDGSGKLGFRDIIDIATMSPLAFDRLDEVESDDDLHDPEKLPDAPKRKSSVRSWGSLRKTGRQYRDAVQAQEKQAEKDDVAGSPPSIKTETKRVGIRALLNLGIMLIVILGVLMLFAGYPIYSHYRLYGYNKFGAYQIGGTNASGQVGQIPGIRTTLIDPDTPQDAYTRVGQDGVTKYNLVFSDEFNTPGRSFYPGDDPFWEAVNLHYWQTKNYEWYDPAGVTTRDGALSITLTQHPDHNLNFRGGMIQSWNKFCFTGGLVVVKVRLPGQPRVGGLWPAIWMMGNLGRAGYGASLEGTWPYTYDSCDAGTMANQTDPATGLPNTTTLGDCSFNSQFNTKALSFLPGQKLSACTCPGEDHPGPKRKDGSFKGRAAPELDIFEAQVSGTLGMTVSQSLQLAPFNAYYKLSEPAELFNNQSRVNSYTGERTQQAASGVTPTDQSAVQYQPDGSTGHFSEYAVEYEPGNEGFIKWQADGKPAWMVNSSQLQPDPVSGISRRPVPEEPLYIIMNLGMSSNFGSVSWDQLKWPNQMDIDWVRVYQHGEPRVGCDPEDFPTKDYINRHIEAYTNPNFTLWGNTREEGGYAHAWPRNRLYPGGCNAPSSNYPGSPLQKVPQARIYKSWQVGEDKSLCAVPNSSS